MTGTLWGSPVRRPTTVRVATPRALSRIANRLARCRVKAGGFRYAMAILSLEVGSSWRQTVHSRGTCGYVGLTRSGATIVWPARSRPAKLSRKQAQRHSTDERAEGADEQPVAPEPAAALVVGDGDSCFHRQD